jgi:hypothetical protein
MTHTAVSDDELHSAIADQLDFTGDAAVRERIVSTLTRLPEDVRAFAVERCRFATSDVEPEPAPTSDQWLVTLPGRPDATAVARGVAHAWLDYGSRGHGATSEDEADDLVSRWEFTGPGDDA